MIIIIIPFFYSEKQILWVNLKEFYIVIFQLVKSYNVYKWLSSLLELYQL